MLFAFAIFLISIFLFNLKVIVGTVVIEDMVISLREEVTVFINLRLDQVPFLCQDTECPVDIMKFVLWWFQKALRSQKGRTFTAWLQYPGVDQIGQDSIEIIFIVMPVTNLSADTVQAQLVINRLQEKITTLEFSFFTVRDFPVWMKTIGRQWFSFSCSNFSVSIRACSFAQFMTSSLVGPCSRSNSFKVPSLRMVLEVDFPLASR